MGRRADGASSGSTHTHSSPRTSKCVQVHSTWDHGDLALLGGAQRVADSAELSQRSQTRRRPGPEAPS